MTRETTTVISMQIMHRPKILPSDNFSFVQQQQHRNQLGFLNV
jgi:hypothetical protein